MTRSVRRAPHLRVQAVPVARVPQAHFVRSRELALALARLPVRLKRSLRRFRETTGERATFALLNPHAEPDDRLHLNPPLHPLCRKHLRTAVDFQCAHHWDEHVRRTFQDGVIHSHLCPLGLQCTSIPMYLGSSLVGLAKLVLEPRTTAVESAQAAATLTLAIMRACQQSYVGVLHGRLVSLQVRLDGHVRLKEGDTGTPREPHSQQVRGLGSRPSMLVQRALEYLSSQFSDPDLDLARVAADAGCNPRYLTHLFRKVVGERMRSHLLRLRVQHVCTQLVMTNHLIKEIASSSGFRDSGTLGRTFRRHVGISPGRYRELFGAAQA